MPGRNIGPVYADLLDAAHKKFTHGLSIENEQVQKGTQDNGLYYQYRSTVTGRRKVGDEIIVETFTSHGDCSPNEPGASRGPVKDAPDRMAETRAVVRALRNATNVGQAAAEEMPAYTGPIDGYEGGEDAAQEPARAEPKPGPDEPMNESQKRFIDRLVAEKYGEGEEARLVFIEEHGHPGTYTVARGTEVYNILKDM